MANAKYWSDRHQEMRGTSLPMRSVATRHGRRMQPAGDPLKLTILALTTDIAHEDS